MMDGYPNTVGQVLKMAILPLLFCAVLVLADEAPPPEPVWVLTQITWQDDGPKKTQEYCLPHWKCKKEGYKTEKKCTRWVQYLLDLTVEQEGYAEIVMCVER